MRITAMKYEDVYLYIGELGCYQLCVYAVIFLLSVFSCDSIHMIFIGADMAHWCRVEELVHLPYDQQKYVAVPYDESAADGYSSCHVFADRNYSVYSAADLYNWTRLDGLNTNASQAVTSCKKWEYDQTVFQSTIVSKVRFKQLIMYSKLDNMTIIPSSELALL